MSRSRKILLAVIYGVNVTIAIVWLVLFGRAYSFQVSRVYFTPGIPVLIVMLIVDGLIFFALSRKSK